MSFLVRSYLSKGDLSLYLSNENGYAQDAAQVLWTVIDKNGTRVSGEKLLATKSSVGSYYAPFFSDVQNGNYKIVWQIKETWASNPKIIEEPFFIIDPSRYKPCSGHIKLEDVPIPGGRCYLSGTQLGPLDLPLYLKDSDGFLSNALAVFWTIVDACGRCVARRSYAERHGVGSYFAPWIVDISAGDYFVIWEFQKDSSSPMQSKKMGFSVINSSENVNRCKCHEPCVVNDVDPIVPGLFTRCGPIRSPVSTTHYERRECVTPEFNSFQINCVPVIIPKISNLARRCDNDSSEVPRTIHLPFGRLPVGSVFTDQPQYHIPSGIHHITFSTTYQRGAPGGYAVLNVLWGDGVDEVQETIFDTDIAPDDNPLDGTQSLFLQNLKSPTPITDDPIHFILYVRVPGGSKTVRLVASEVGFPPSPGYAGITLTASG